MILNNCSTICSGVDITNMNNNNNFVPNPMLEMLMQREQLMEDIDSIVETFCWEMWEGKYPETQEELTRILCDAVCKNFPVK